MTIRPNPTTNSLLKTHNPWLMLMITLGMAMIGFQFIGSFFGLLLAFPFYPGDIDMFFQALLNPTSDENMRTPFLIMQGTAAFIGFIIMPWLLLTFYYKGQIADLSSSITKSQLVVITVFIALFFMGVNAPFIEWNQNFVFPEALAGLEEKLKALEETLAKTSEFITNFDNIGQLF